MTKTEKQVMIQALEKFKECYYDILHYWATVNLDETDSIALYPFEKSFDELNLPNWVDATVKELEINMKKLKKIKYLFEDSGNCRKYYKGEDGRLYCSMEWNGNIEDWLVCEESGEPSHSVAKYYDFEIIQ